MVTAAGASSDNVSHRTATELPGYPLRKDCTVLAPTRLILMPAVAFRHGLCYIWQATRCKTGAGERAPARPQTMLPSDLPALTTTVRVYYDMLQCLSSLRTFRQRAGLVHAASLFFAPLIGPPPFLQVPWITAECPYGCASPAAIAELLVTSILN